jgi:hypothetical protein
MGIERVIKPTDFKVLGELSAPLNGWLRKNYNPHTRIIIEWDFVKVVADEAGMPLCEED